MTKENNHAGKKPTIAQANMKAARARARVAKMAAMAEAVAAQQTSELIQGSPRCVTAVSERMSSVGFGKKDPHAALRVLQLLEAEDIKSFTFEDLGLTSYKYTTSILASRLVETGLRKSMKAANQPAAQALRFVYEVALQTNPKAYDLLEWHNPQKLLQGKASRGVGIAATNADAKALLANAMHVAKTRIAERVEQADQYLVCCHGSEIPGALALRIAHCALRIAH